MSDDLQQIRERLGATLRQDLCERCKRPIVDRDDCMTKIKRISAELQWRMITQPEPVLLIDKNNTPQPGVEVEYYHLNCLPDAQRREIWRGRPWRYIY